MRLPVVFMFSGQSSQYYQMGRELYHSHPRFRMWMDHCDEIAEPLIGRSLSDILYGEGDKSKPFDRLLYTNPALLCFEYSLARVLIEAGVKPDYLLGYSLGEFSAAVVGGALTLEQGIRFIVDYAKLIEAECPPARMLAVLDLPTVETRYADLFDGCWLTARNFDRHIVVTGSVPAIQSLREAMLNDNVVHQLLAVNFGFHTEMVQPIEHKMLELAQQIDFQPLQVPCISSFDGSIRDAQFDTNLWPRHFWSLSRHPIAFDTTVQSLLRRGDHCFLDVGPSGTLATFVKYLLPAQSASVFSDVVNPFGRDNRTFGNALRCGGVVDVLSA